MWRWICQLTEYSHHFLTWIFIIFIKNMILCTLNIHKLYVNKVVIKLVSAIFSMCTLICAWVHVYPCVCSSEGNVRCHYSNFIPFVFWHRVSHWPVTDPIGQTGWPESQRFTRSLLTHFGWWALITMLRFFFKWVLRMELGFPGCW